MMKNFDLGNGHTLLITDAIEFKADDTYKVSFFEDEKQLFNSEYMSKEAIEEQYGITF